MLCKETKYIFALAIKTILRGGAVVARRAHNPKVVGSSPAPATKKAVDFSTAFCIFGVMYTVYVLYSPNFNRIYIGSTSNLEQRFLSHNKLSKKGYTIRYRPWVIAFTEDYENKKEALQREKFLKTGKGRALVWEKIRQLGLISA